jgi:hypothetical protein
VREVLGYMGEVVQAFGVKRLKVKVAAAIAFAAAGIFSAVAIATGAVGGADPAASEHHSTVWVSTHDRFIRNEALPCTGPSDPTNFEIFSAGPSVERMPLTHFVRRCDASAPAYEAPANYTTYVYGHCQLSEGATGCQPPLEVQSWPACQRSLGDYSFEGKLLPYRELAKRGRAVVVEINFMLDHRVEVYTKSATIVIFAIDSALAKKAVALLRSQEKGKPPAKEAKELKGGPDEALGAPSDEAMEGVLPCRS